MSVDPKAIRSDVLNARLRRDEVTPIGVEYTAAEQTIIDAYERIPRFEGAPDNTGIGFHYTLSDEQLQNPQQRSVEEIFTWLSDLHDLMSAIQTPEERDREYLYKPHKLVGRGKIPLGEGKPPTPEA